MGKHDGNLRTKQARSIIQKTHEASLLPAFDKLGCKPQSCSITSFGFLFQERLLLTPGEFIGHFVKQGFGNPSLGNFLFEEIDLFVVEMHGRTSK